MKKQGYPELQHLICPRFKGTQDILREVRLQLLVPFNNEAAACSATVKELRTFFRSLPIVVVFLSLQGRDTFKAVYDVTIGYKPVAKYLFWRCARPASKLCMANLAVCSDLTVSELSCMAPARDDLFCRLPAEVHVHIDRLPIETVPVCCCALLFC